MILSVIRDRNLLERMDLSRAKKTLKGCLLYARISGLCAKCSYDLLYTTGTKTSADRSAKEASIRDDIAALQTELASMQVPCRLVVSMIHHSPFLSHLLFTLPLVAQSPRCTAV